MRRLFACTLLLGGTALAQESPIQIALDPPGNNMFLQYADASILSDGSILVLDQNTWSLSISMGVLTKLNPDGTVLWSRSFEPATAGFTMSAKRVLAMPDGGATVYAITYDAMWLLQQYVLIRFDANGNVTSSQGYSLSTGGSDFDYGYSCARPTADGGIVLNMGYTANPTFVKMDPSGNILWSRKFITDDPDTSKVPTFDFGIDDNGGLIITEKANSDMMLIRTDANGNVLWSHRYPTGLYTHTKIAVPLANGDILCSGYSSYPFAARLDAAGNVLWMRGYPMPNIWDGFQRIIELPDGDIILSGRSLTAGSSAVSDDLFLRIEANGTPVGKAVRSSELTSTAMEVVGLHDGKLVIGGQATLPIDGGYDSYQMIWRVDADPSGMCGAAPDLVAVMATDLEPMVSMSDGCTITDNTVLVNAFPVDVVNAVNVVTDLCAMITDVPELDGQVGISIYPSPVAAGTEAVIELIGAAARVEIIGADGRLVASHQVNGRQRVPVTTAGWSDGLYLVRVSDDSGVLLASSRLVVQ